MPHVSQISTHYRQHARAFLSLLKKAGDLRSSHIHKLRVEIKNLLAFGEFIGVIFGSRKYSKKLSKSLRPLFRNAGRIRVYQLDLRMLQPHRAPALEGFRDYLSAAAGRAEKKFVNRLAKFDQKVFKKLHKKNTEILSRMGKKELPGETIGFLRSQFAIIRSEMLDISDNATLHEIRKKLKLIRSIGSLLSESGIEHPFAKELAQVNKIYDDIGYWHDLQVLRSEMEFYMEGLEDPEEIGQLNATALFLRKKALRIKKQVGKKLKDVLL
jgi:CHAD domain-containing protein